MVYILENICYPGSSDLKRLLFSSLSSLLSTNACDRNVEHPSVVFLAEENGETNEDVFPIYQPFRYLIKHVFNSNGRSVKAEKTPMIHTLNNRWRPE